MVRPAGYRLTSLLPLEDCEDRGLVGPLAASEITLDCSYRKIVKTTQKQFSLLKTVVTIRIHAHALWGILEQGTPSLVKV